MHRFIQGALPILFAASFTSACVVYRRVPVDPNEPPQPGEPGQPGPEAEPQAAPPTPEPPPGYAQANPQPGEEPVQPKRRKRLAPRADVAPRVTAPTVFGDGTGGAFRGLVYLMPDDIEKLPDFSRIQPVGEVFTDRFDIKSQEFKGGFPGVSREDEWFAIKYDGPFYLSEGGTWRFRLVSDDGSALYVDGVKIIENDGVHGARSLKGQATLTPGKHQLRLDYFQGNKGPVALQLYASPPSAPGTELVLQGVR